MSHALSEARKHKNYDYERITKGLLASSKQIDYPNEETLTAAVFISLPGIDTKAVSKPIFAQLQTSLSLTKYSSIEELQLDFNALSSNATIDQVQSFIAKKLSSFAPSKSKNSKTLLVIHVVVNPLIHARLLDTFVLIEQELLTPIHHVTSVVAPEMIFKR